MANKWAELPRELLGKIMKRLCINSIDSFKIVCHPWHSAVEEEAHLSLLRPVPSPPWLTIPESSSKSDDDDDDDEKEKKKKKKKGKKKKKKKKGKKKKKDMLSARFFNPTNNKVCSFQNDDEEMKRWLPDPEEAVCVGSSHGWLAFIDSRCVIYLTNPFKKGGGMIVQLPSIVTLPCILGVERQRSSPSGDIIIDFEYWNYFDQTTYTAPSNDTYRFFITKLVVSSASAHEYTAMAIYGELRDLAFCKSGDTSWTPLNTAKSAFYLDVYYSTNDQCFYAYRGNGSLEIWDLHHPSSSSPPNCTYIELPLMPSVPPLEITSHEQWLRDWCPTRERYLVNFDGDLLLAVKYIAASVTEDGELYTEHDQGRTLTYKTLRFDIYKLDWVKKQWVYVRCLGNGDGVLFLGINNALSFSAYDFPALRANSIYFTDDIIDFRPRIDSLGGHDLGIFTLDDNSFHPCFYPGNFKRISPPPFWIAPNPF